MLSWLQSRLTLILSVISFCTLIWGGLSSHLYIESQKELTSLKTQYKQLQSTYEDLSKSKDNLDKSYKESLDSVASLQKDLLSIKDSSNKAVSNIQSYKQKCTSSNTSGNKNETIYVNVDAPFDPEFVRLSE